MLTMEVTVPLSVNQYKLCLEHINRHGRHKGRNYPHEVLENISIHLEASTAMVPPSAGSMFEAFSKVFVQGLFLS